MATDTTKLREEINTLFDEIETLQGTLDIANTQVRDAYAAAASIKESIDAKKKQLAQRMRIAGFLEEK